ncbi:TVP38/TMEM64 family protein [Priestia abyssalis]|uniref:TVP38/TMEM64 family protein n=1 Tax=Priestia abyssalis TaxID=1221450 RepID=UPI001F3099D4|nr:VTT domain-containing protein [Priestia abyssalis]
MIKEKYKWTLEILLHLFLSGITIYLSFAFLPTLLPIYKTLFGAAVAGILLLDLYFVLSNHKEYLKVTKIALILLSSSIFVVLLIFYGTKFLVLTDTYGMETVLKEKTSFATFLFFLICFSQPIILPIPEAVTVPAGSAVFGPFITAILSFSGTVAGIMVMFFIARIGEQKFVSKLVKEKHLRKYQEYVGKNETTILALMFMIPILPDEIICVGAGISGISLKRFFIIASISKFITSSLLASSVHLAKLLSLTSSQLMMSCSAIVGIMLAVSLIFKRFLEKNKTRERMNE